MRCPVCSREARTLDARSVLTVEAGNPSGTVTTESQIIVQCDPVPEGCGSRRLVARTVTVRDEGETRRGRIAR
jgi:hypothetical protein